MKNSLIVVELVGPAGAGKSTLTEALCKHDEHIRTVFFPNIRDAKNLPFFLWNAFVLIPTFVALYRNQSDGTISSQQMVLMTVLSGWHKQLKSGSAEQEIIVLDQGPVYLLAELLRFGPQGFRRVASKWWERVCREWSNVLDVVICLDTSDMILMERIRTRVKSHGIKEHSDDWASQFLAQYRDAQSEVLHSMADKNRDLKMISIDTSRDSSSETVEKIFALLTK